MILEVKAMLLWRKKVMIGRGHKRGFRGASCGLLLRLGSIYMDMSILLIYHVYLLCVQFTICVFISIKKFL